MAATWQTDIEAGQDWVAGLIVQTADARGWSSAVEARAQGLAEDAVPAGISAWFADPQDYYAKLAGLWHTGAPASPPAGWDELGVTWAAAGNASYTASEEARLGSPVTLVTGTIAASAGDVAQAGEAGLDFWDPAKGWTDASGYKFWAAAVGAIGVSWVVVKALK